MSKLKRFESEYDWPDVEYPFATRYIGKFEKNNKISVNILAVEGERIYILRKLKYDYRNVNLMLITGENSFPDEMWKHNRKHYIAIKSLSRLLTKANTKHNGNQHHCTNCLHRFPMEISKNEHESYCVCNKPVRVEMPMRRPWVRYSKGQYQFKVPFAMYVDFESLLTKLTVKDSGMGASCIVNVHEPSGWCVKSEFEYGEVKDPIKMYRGKDYVEKFANI